MHKNFTKFADNIRLTADQELDAQTKYEGVCKKLHSAYYNTEWNGSTKLLFGSYRLKTNVRPLTPNHDVDVLFKIPKETYERFKNYQSNGPSSLLQEIKDHLKEKYTTTDKIKAWGKVVLVQFTNNTHNVELLPAYEEEDGTFTIPNSENGGSWEKFDPRKQVNLFQKSNNTTNGLTAELSRMIKTWLNKVATCDYKSYNLQSDVMKFLDSNFKSGADFNEYSNVIKSFFEYLYINCEDNIKSHVKTALERAEKAYNYEREEKPKEASEEWIKIFGNEFPATNSNPTKESQTRIFTNPSAPYGSYQA
jgi:hypothetical protein